MTPERFLADYSSGRRDFQGINLLGEYLEPLASEIDEYEYLPPAAGLPFGYWRETVSPLGVDRKTPALPELYEGAPVFHWEDDAFMCLLERNWEDLDEDPPEVEVVDFTGAELAAVNLQGAYLYRVNLTGANLEGARLQRAILVDVDMSCAKLRSADLREAVASGTRFIDADLTGVRAERAALEAADFTGSNLSRIRFRRANLAFTIWRGATLSRSRFSRNSLLGADFRGLDLAGVRFGDSVVSGCLISPRQVTALLNSLSISRDPHAPYRRHVWLDR